MKGWYGGGASSTEVQGRESGRRNGRSKGSEVRQARRLLEKPQVAGM